MLKKGNYGKILQATSYGGNEEDDDMPMLVSDGVDMSMQEGWGTYRDALQVAYENHDDDNDVPMLISKASMQGSMGMLSRQLHMQVTR
jgi:hypothetical protein